MWRHRVMIGSPRYGVIGLVTMVYFAVFELLSPIFALLGLAVTIGLALAGVVGAWYLVTFVAVSLGLGLALSTAALALEEATYRTYDRRRDVLRLLAYTLLENVGYRQLHHGWRLLGFVDIVRGKTEWGAQERRGLARPVDS